MPKFGRAKVEAEILGELGRRRHAVYIPYANQLGQTGMVVSPDLCIACGISGADSISLTSPCVCDSIP
jgi:electron transfer flavoprotein alpha subunit